MSLISIVIPVFNEAKSIRKNCEAILQHLVSIANVHFELVFVNDGSADETEREIASFAEGDSRVRLISFTRNFGKEAAIIAGLSGAKGDAVIVMDSDLQHPPQLIQQMIECWKKGFPVVEAFKVHRGKESLFNKFSASLFYMILKRLSDFSLAGHSDFKLLDRQVVEAYLALPEKHKFFRGLVWWLGFTSIQIPFEVPERLGNEGSRWSKRKLIGYAIRNITVFSSVPLSLVATVGMICLAGGFVLAAISIWQKINGVALSGFTTVNLLIVFLSGAILFCLGIVSHYIALIYDEIKRRPHFIEKPLNQESRSAPVIGKN